MNLAVLNLPALEAEIFLTAWSLLLLVFGAFYKPAKSGGVIDDANEVSKRISLGAILGFAFASILVINAYLGTPFGYNLIAFPRTFSPESAVFMVDGFSSLVKILILIGALVSTILARTFLNKIGETRPEFFILVMLSVVGMLVAVSAADFLVLYLGLEIMSFSLYILTAYLRGNSKGAESGLKYFILGSIASAIMLYGISMFYGITGDTLFTSLQQVTVDIAHGKHPSFILTIGLVFMLCGLAFKISAAPFHMWTPDVYEGAPTPVTAFMSVVVKIAAIAVLLRVLYIPLISLWEHWQNIIIILSLFTMGAGAFASIVQTNIKRLLAYSSIAHVGFMLVGLVATGAQSVGSVIGYLIMYAVTTFGVFSVLNALQNRGEYIEDIKSLAGLGKTNPLLAFAMLIFMFSLAGIPPLAGFWAKFMVFAVAIDAGLWWLAIIGVLFSVVAAYYSLNIVKVMYFDSGKPKVESPIPAPSRNLIAIFVVLTVILGLFPSQIIYLTQAAASQLF